MTHRMSEGPLTSEQSIEYGLSLAQEIKRRHQRGAVLGTLRPDLITLNGATSSIVESHDQGLSAYSAPELLEGHAGDQRSDIFSFGAILQELLTGRKPFEGNTPEEWKASQARRETAPPNGMQSELSRLINRCLATKPEKRWQNISAVVVELKLLANTNRHSKAAADFKNRMAALRDTVGGLDGRLTAQHDAHEAAVQEVHRSLSEVSAKTEEHVAVANMVVSTLENSVHDLENRSEVQARALESIQSAVAQTDDVIDHVVDAFDTMHRMVLERAEAETAIAAKHSN